MRLAVTIAALNRDSWYLDSVRAYESTILQNSFLKLKEKEKKNGMIVTSPHSSTAFGKSAIGIASLALSVSSEERTALKPTRIAS
jgi:hypothetical protein